MASFSVTFSGHDDQHAQAKIALTERAPNAANDLFLIQPNSAKVHRIRELVDDAMRQRLAAEGPEQETMYVTVTSDPQSPYELRFEEHSVPIVSMQIEVKVVRFKLSIDHGEAAQYIAPSLGIDNPVDQYHVRHESGMSTAAGVTTAQQLSGERMEMHHTISFHEPLDYNAIFEAALERYLQRPI